MFNNRLIRQLIAATTLTLGVSGLAQAFEISIYTTGSSINNLNDAKNAIANGTLYASETRDSINFFDGSGSDGHFDIDQSAFPGGANSHFALHATGSVYIDTTGFYTFGSNHDDGMELNLNGSTLFSYPQPTNNRDTFGSLHLTAGYHDLELIYYEQGGGASVELFSAQGSYTSYNNHFELTRSSEQPSTVDTPGSLLAMLAGLPVLLRTRRKTPVDNKRVAD